MLLYNILYLIVLFQSIYYQRNKIIKIQSFNHLNVKNIKRNKLKFVKNVATIIVIYYDCAEHM